jgi:heme/copper-type cytochrome/quinol oxidase subunit 3
MFTFLASEAMLFSGLICGYMVLGGGAGSGWQMPEALRNVETMVKTIVATLCLISSSFTLRFAEGRLIRQTKGGKISSPAHDPFGVGVSYEPGARVGQPPQ